jgi:hypothetical protein
MPKKSFVLEAFLRHASRVRLGYGLVLDGAPQALAPAMSAEMVRGRVTRDAKQPRGRAGVARLESIVCLISVHEHLGCDVLGIGRGANLRPDIRIDPTEEVAVQIFKWWPIGRHGRFMVLASTPVLTQRPTAGVCNGPRV